MRDLYYFNVGSVPDVNRALDEFANRGALILEHVFHKGDDVRQAFRQWFRDLTIQHNNPALILHDEPLYLTARYLGVDVAAVHTGAILREYQQLAVRNHW
jgi:hypothetical protein